MDKGSFDKFRRNEEEPCNCGNCRNEEIAEDSGSQNSAEALRGTLSVKVYGPGCSRCRALKDNVLRALSDSGRQADFEYITDMEALAAAGIMATPSLEVDGAIVSSGTVLKPKDIAIFLQ